MGINKSVLVTGGTGFIGRHLINQLVRENWDVHALVRKRRTLNSFSGEILQLTQHVYDGTLENVRSIVEGSNPRVILHLAALSIRDHELKDLDPMINANLLLGVQLLETIKYLKAPIFINTGSYWQYDETGAYCPVNLYAATKQAFVDILQCYTGLYDIRSLTLVLFDVYGPHDDRNKLFNLLKISHETNHEPVMTPGAQLIDLVYVDDVVAAYLRAVDFLQNNTTQSNSNIFAVSSGKPIPLKKAVQIYEKALGHSLNIKWGGRPYHSREVMTPWKGPRIPGWRSKVDLAAGIKLLLSSELERR